MAPSAVLAWTPRTDGSAASSGFSVDTSNRNDVVSFWHGAYTPSESYWERIDWTGSYDSTAVGAEGSTSAEFVRDVERRVNFVRALCGVPAVVSMNTNATVLIESGDNYQPPASTTKQAAVQRSALMAALGTTGDALSHNPPSTLAAWTVEAWNSHNKSAITKGFFGPAAVDAYFREDIAGISNWNFDAGHRRWLLSVPVTDMATGDTPGHFNFATSRIIQPSNLIYVKPKSSEVSSASGRFVSYPGAGFFPVGLNTPFWSLSRDGADFSSASVNMTDDSGVSVPVTVISSRSGFAENAIVWSVPDVVKSMSAPVDRTYHLTVSGIGGGVGSSHSWSVALIDPYRLNDPLDLSGPATAMAGGDTNYALNPVPGCDVMQTGFFLREDAVWMETAEDGSEASIIDRSDPSYELRARVTQQQPDFPSDFFTEGSKAFRLAFPRLYDPRLNTIADEIFELDRQILPGPSAAVVFQFRRGFMSPTTVLGCESSADGGLTWRLVASPLAGNSSGQPDTTFNLISIPLNQTGSPIRLRFRLYRSNPSGGVYPSENFPELATGAFIDELRVDGCEWLKPGGVVETSPSESIATFGPSTATLPVSGSQQWVLRTRPVMAGYEFPWGPAKQVQVVGPLEMTGASEPPISGATYSFIPEPTAESHIFEVARFSSGDWNEGAESEPSSAIVDGTSSAYTLVSTRSFYQVSGNASFRVAVQASDGEDYFEVDRDVLATTNSQLDFWLRRGWSKNQQLDIELSTNGGTSWTSIWSIEGLTAGESSGSSYSVSLSGYAGSSIRCRYVLRSTGSVTYSNTLSGMWIDDVGMTNVEQISSSVATPVSSGSAVVQLNALTAGETLIEGAAYRLRIVPVFGGVAGEPGPPFFVTPSVNVLTGFEAWIAYEYPTLTGGFEGSDGRDGVANGIKYAFGLQPSGDGLFGDEVFFDPDVLILERSLDSLREGVLYEAEFSEDLSSWSTSGVIVNHAGGVLKAVVNHPDGPGFLRWKITEE